MENTATFIIVIKWKMSVGVEKVLSKTGGMRYDRIYDNIGRFYG